MSEENSAEAQVETEAIDQVEGESSEGQPQKPQKAESAQVQSMMRKLQMKIDGEDIEEDYDLSNEEQLKKDIQLARAARKRMAEAQDQKRKAFDIVQQFEQDPASVLKRLGPKGYELAEQLLLEKMQSEMMSPQEREYQEMKSRLSKYEATEKSQKEEMERQNQESIEAKHAQTYQQTIISALDKSGLPKTPEMAKRMAFLLHKNLELGLDLDANDLADEARKEALGYVSSLTKDADAEKLLNLLGPEIAKKIRKHDLDQLKQKQFGKGTGTKSLTQSSMAPRPKAKTHLSFEEWQAETARRIAEDN